MSDSNEPAGAAGPDEQPSKSAPNDRPQTAPDPAPPSADAPDPPPPPDEQDAPTQPAERDAEPPAVASQDTPPPTDEEDRSTPPPDEQDAPTQPAERDAEPPAVASQDTPPPADEKDRSTPPPDKQDAPTQPAERDAEPPAVVPQDTPPPPAEAKSPPPAGEQEVIDAPPDEQDATDGQEPPADAQGDEAGKADTPALQKADKPGAPAGDSKAPRAPGKGRSAGPRSSRRRPGKPPKGPSVVIRYGLMGHIGQFRHNLQPAPARGVNVVVRTDRGVELGEVVTVVSEEPGFARISPQRLEQHIAANGPDYPFRRDGKVLRLANPQDLIDQRHLNSSAKDERKFCAQEIKEMKLDMKLVAVEHLLGGERIIFYFLAEHRVDFRDLVHKLANQYHTRIEMRQVGARDEARLVGDYERCGQVCCCKEFLKGLQPVSMRMAKTQKATLDPSKISGRCGRLMCCLRYEDQCYRDLKKRLPHKNIWVKTRDQIGRVTDTQILTQLVQVQLPDGSRGVFANEDIIERNVAPPQETPATSPKPSKPVRDDHRSRKKQTSAPPKRQAKPAEDKPKPKRETKPQPAPRKTPAPKPEPQPRASAQALDPGWAQLLGDSVIESDSARASQSPQEPPTIPAGEEPQAAPQAQATTDPATTPEPTQGQAPGSPSGDRPAQTGKKPKKRRRRRGRRSKRKKGN